MFVTALVLPVSAGAQDRVEELWESCVETAEPALELACADGALALQAVHSGIGLLMSAGGPLPASPSTAGRRLASSPRIVVDLGGGWSSFGHPDLRRPRAPDGLPDRRSTLVAGRLAVAGGLFEGFSPAPTVGGVLSVDAVAMFQLLRLPESGGFSGTAPAWGAGIRLGVFRESFSLPGVTLSALHHRTGRVRYGDLEESGASVSLRPTVTSVRATVGKDLLAVGLSAGAGWDRSGGRGAIEVGSEGSGADPGTSVAASGGLRSNRRYLFVGANYTWLIAQLAGELTWARSVSPLVELEGSGPFRPGGTELQGAVTFRVVY